ncbi:hypothetical protein GCM10010912_18100 [Paenibacillus albidus]|uniref:Uncharacterized protein n=1 Tax=Paenibacillus albidus TaxID=2041023 RepID=A0A917C740_9BACL|nr:hypothetical protein [Paenibacillus albidus]GGF73264.1 hypothetical protein GCM10010912_18100 [Paenibacillus albidus]
MTIDRLLKRRQVWKRMNELIAFENRGFKSDETSMEIAELRTFLRTREG